MPFSTCCHAHTNYPDIHLCPDCLQYCDWIDDDLETIKPNNNEPTDND